MFDQKTFHASITDIRLPAEHSQQFERHPASLDFFDSFFSFQWQRFFPQQKIPGQDIFLQEVKNTQHAEGNLSLDELKKLLNEINITSQPVPFFMILHGIARKLFKQETTIDIWQSYMMYTGHAVNDHNAMTLELGIAAAGLALSARPVHFIYADNESLHTARKKLMPFFETLDLYVGCIDKDTPQAQRRNEYLADICFCVAEELVFDYLRDRLRIGDMNQPLRLQAEVLYRQRPRMKMLALRGLHVALIANIDEVLVDAARAPLEITETSADAEAESRTLARLSYPGFFRRYGQLGGCGNLFGLATEFWNVYRLGVIAAKQKNISQKSKKVNTHFYFNEEDKWQAILSEVQRSYKSGCPVCLSVETQPAAEKIQLLLQQASLAYEIRKENKAADNESQSEHVPIMLLLGNVSRRAPEKGSLIFVEYQLSKRSPFRSKQENVEGKIVSFSAMDDKLLSTIVADSLYLKFLTGILRYIFKINSWPGNYLLRYYLALADHKGEVMQAKARRSLLRQEIQKGKMLSFAGRGE